MPHIKSLCHPVSEEKKIEDGLLCSYVPTCDPQGRASFDLRGKFGRGPQGDAIPNIKALGLPVSEKKNFKVFLLCCYVSNL